MSATATKPAAAKSAAAAKPAAAKPATAEPAAAKPAAAKPAATAKPAAAAKPAAVAAAVAAVAAAEPAAEPVPELAAAGDAAVLEQVDEKKAPSTLFARLRGLDKGQLDAMRKHGGSLYNEVVRFLASGHPPRMAKAGVVIARTVLLSGADDIEILRELRRAACIVNKSATRAQAPSGANSGRSASRLRDMDWAFAIIRSALRRSGTADAPARVRLLDIGCAEGSHTEAVAETLKIPADDAHACDVMPQPANPRFQFRLCDRKTELLPYEDAEFNLILMLMSEHHFAKPEVVFEEAARVTAPGGFLIMRDHDAQTAEQCAFFDIVHALYDCVLGDAPVAPERFLADYASGATTFNYRSAMYWVTLAEKYGFKLIGDVRPPAGGPDRFRSFYALFQRRAVTAASAAPSATAK